LATKLAPPEEDLYDDRPGPSLRLAEPARIDALRIANRGLKMPKLPSMQQPTFRASAHHIMANHELQALEVMAWTLCAFPDAPTPFRLGVIKIMLDEQRHTRMHLARLRELGHLFGDWPVNGHVWLRCRDSQNLLDYLACLPLTFEGGNLDHSLEFANAFDQAGASQSRDVMRAIHIDEIDHVAFGVHWLRQLKPAALSDWETYITHLRWPMSPYRAKGNVFQRQARLEAGMTADFIDGVEQTSRSKPGLREDQLPRRL
jgi:uncharacterized ferritin-like protein (DUF455 family)